LKLLSVLTSNSVANFIPQNSAWSATSIATSIMRMGLIMNAGYCWITQTYRQWSEVCHSRHNVYTCH